MMLLPLAIGVGGLFVAQYLLKRAETAPNVTPYNGQLFTVNKIVDAMFLSVAEEFDIGRDKQEGANLLMFHCFSESGLNPQAHNNYINGKYVSRFDVESTYLPSVFAGGLFGLVKKFSKKYIVGLTFAEWLQSGYVAQIESMRLWLKDWNVKGKIKTPLDIRVLGFAPARLGIPLGATVYENNEDPTKAQAYINQSYLDTNKDNKITMGELAVIYTKKYNDHVDYAIKNHGPRKIKIK